MRIEVPFLPPAECSPNARVHWSDRYKTSSPYQSSVFYCAVDARNRLYHRPRRIGDSDPPFDRARLDLTFVVANRRSRDEDNWRARFVPGQNALVQAGLIPDDMPAHLVLGEIHFEVDKARAPLTIIDLVAVQ